ncbi:MAG: hypothetical protein AAGD07_05215 [Planctomycetota bacterium]
MRTNSLRPTLWAAWLISCVVVDALAQGQGWADLPLESIRVPLIQQLEQAKFDAPSHAELDDHQQAAASAISQLEQRLRNEEHGEGWQDYLRLESLRSRLLTSGPAITWTEVDVTRLRLDLDKARERLIRNHPGVETASLVRLRDALHALSLALRLKHDKAVSHRFERVRNDMLERLQSKDVGLVQQRREIVRAASWLDEFGQAQEAVSLLRPYCAHPNVVVRLTAGAIEAVTKNEVRKTEPINRSSDGRRITGEALVTGNVWMAPAAPLRDAHLQVVFDGSVRSTLDGKQDPVSFRMVGDTDLRVRQPILMRPEQFLLQAVETQSRTRVHSERIAVGVDGVVGRIIRRLAVREMQDERSTTEAELDKGTRDRFVASFREDVADQINKNHARFEDGILLPLARMDLQSRTLGFESDGDSLQLAMLVNGGFGLGASGNPNLPSASTADIQIAIHETSFNRVAQRFLAGEIITDLASLARKVGTSLPEGLEESALNQFEVRFADFQPITATFEGGQMRFTCRADAYRVGSVQLVGMNIIIAYQITAEDGNLRFALADKPRVVAPESGRSGRFYVQKNILSRRLQAELPVHRAFPGFQLEDLGQELGELQFVHAACDDGWLQVSMKGDR